MNEKAAMELLAAQKAITPQVPLPEFYRNCGKEEAQKVESTGVPTSVVKQVDSPSGSGGQRD